MNSHPLLCWYAGSDAGTEEWNPPHARLHLVKQTYAFPRYFELIWFPICAAILPTMFRPLIWTHLHILFYYILVICLYHEPICHLDTAYLNSSSPGPNGRHFADDIFKRFFLNGKVRFLTKISLKIVPWDPINNNPAYLDDGFAPKRRQAIIWTNADLIHWRIYATLGGVELYLGGFWQPQMPNTPTKY